MRFVHSSGDDAVRAVWLDHVIRELQCAVGSSLSRDRYEARALLATSTRAISAPGTRLEHVLLRSLLLQFALRWGRTFHDQFHRTWRCRFSPGAIAEEVWTDDAVNAAELFDLWTRRFFAEFDRSHPVSISERAAQLIQREYHNPCRLREIATRLRVTPPRIARAFRWRYGVSIKEYQRALRIIEAVEHLKDDKVEAVALQVGFRSRKDFNRALEQSTGLTPTQFKHLSTDRAKDIIETTRLLVWPTRRRRELRAGRLAGVAID